MNDSPIHGWLIEATDRGASDLHLIAGYLPAIRLHGRLVPIANESLDPKQVSDWLLYLLPEEGRERLRAHRNADFAIDIPRGNKRQRYRANYFYSSDSIGACFRVIPDRIPELEWAGFPRQLAERLASFRNGLIISCGVTGAGKTTTLAMIINQLCRQGDFRIVTIEEPIEYLFPKNHGSLVTQREVGRDVMSFDEGLKYSLRQDPDVILVGEIRDRETAQTALRAAETGHLVFATLHTRDAKGAISRYADLFGQDTQQEIRSQLSVSLRAIISQCLIPSAVNDDKRVLALEIMINNSPIAIAIRHGRLDNIDNAILTGRSDGMITLNESIRRLYQSGEIDFDTARRYATDPGFIS